jgi:threonine dehydrogenase-like Zn-dependent dehydrogenase
MPAHVNPKLGVFVPLLQTSFNGILDSQVNLGETTVVFGAGIVGQLALLFLKLSGAEVIVVDLFEERLAIAKSSAQTRSLTDRTPTPANMLKKNRRTSADVCIKPLEMTWLCMRRSGAALTPGR